MSQARSFPLLPRIALVLLVSLAGLLTAAAAVASTKSDAAPLYLRIAVSPTSSVYIEFRNDEMRVAGAAKDLERAKPVKATASGSQYSFPEVELPVAKQELPAGFSKLTTTLKLFRFRSSLGFMPRQESVHAFGTLGLAREDSKGVLWTYCTQMSAQPAAAVERAPRISVPKLTPLTLSLVTKTTRRRIGAGLRVMSGTTEVDDILRDGKAPQVQMRLLDNRGKVVASERGPLAKFGFT